MSVVRVLAILGSVLSLAAGAETPPASRIPAGRETGIAPPTRIPPSAETLVPLPEGSPVSTADVPAAVRRAVVADAARRFGVAPSAVVLAQAERLTWSDGSLGCPEPGILYTQNLVPGYRIVAKTVEGELVYHTDSRAHVVSCRAGRQGPANKLSDKSPVRGGAPITQPRAPDR